MPLHPDRTPPNSRHPYLAGLAWMFIPGLIAFALVACNPSPKAKAILADEEIRREICDTFPIIPIQKGDTQITKNYIDHYDTIRDAYCAA